MARISPNQAAAIKEKILIITGIIAAIALLGWLDNLGGIGPADVRAHDFSGQTK